VTIITCQKYGGQAYGGRATLDFDEDQAAFLRAQLDKDEAFQRRMKIAAIVAIAILFAGGVVTTSLCFATIIPYGPMHTLATIGGTSVASLSFMAGIAGSTTNDDYPFCFTSLPACHRLKKEFNEGSHITTEKAWTYLTKYHEEYLQKFKKQAQESLSELLRVQDLTNMVLDYLNDQAHSSEAAL